MSAAESIGSWPAASAPIFGPASAAADLYRLRKSEKVLAARLQTETIEHYGSARTADEVLGTSTGGGGGLAVSPLPKATTYDILLDISSHFPGKDKVTIDIQHLEIDTDKVELSGTAKTSDEIDKLHEELKKIPCFKTIEHGPQNTVGELVQFSLNITSQCMQGGGS